MAQFDYFVIFAEMRTGSNFLEQNLNQFEGLQCYGEAFNPHFIGTPRGEDILGVGQDARDQDPSVLLKAISETDEGIGGFRYFHDHDPRIFETVIEDRRCAKIVLTRNPVDSYVSWKIAQATGQWKLTDAKARKAAQAVFDGEEFARHLEALQAFQVTLLNRLQASGQTAFYVAYEDLQSVAVMNGLARFLGVEAQLEALDKTLKVQNPSALSEKVENFEEMQGALAELDRFNLNRTPNFEPRRGPAVQSWITGMTAPLLYMPVRGPLDIGILQWMARLDGVGRGKLGRKRGQGELRAWLNANPGHRGFTVLRHPLERAHDAFCDKILPSDGSGYPGIRANLRRRYKMPLPEAYPDPAYDLAAHKTAFQAFLTFLKANLAGQTAIRVDQSWASQVQIVSGFAEFRVPDRLLREERLEKDLTALAAEIGYEPTQAYQRTSCNVPFALSAIYDDRIEALSREVYAKDYTQFGFGDWDQAA